MERCVTFFSNKFASNESRIGFLKVRAIEESLGVIFFSDVFFDSEDFWYDDDHHPCATYILNSKIQLKNKKNK